MNQNLFLNIKTLSDGRKGKVKIDVPKKVKLIAIIKLFNLHIFLS